ncbi:tRNA dihydrouridine synthase DusB [Paracoccus endophyticus]|uniref:tRNA dihydrouridine synthase DusB n=1 Tax=Paracoccus endophyticus TaxID=2233774 RepID=UPI000DD55726|nr:tRNA dihydrouridine synthase DusB [Paracoccus endophyticus]
MTADPIRLGPFALDPPVFLAPMAGITDLPFRRAVAAHGAGLVVSEMVASTEMVTPRPSTRAAVRAKARTQGDVPVSVQIAGREAQAMAETARIVAGMGARIIDINMGCPAKKVTGGLSGAALMREPDRALALIEAVVAAVPDLPVTLKMRLGWDDDCLNAPELARRARDAGVRMIAVHGRTRAQFYTGRADWSAIRAVRDAVPGLPLVANGDIVDAASARAARAASGADAVMIGRGAQGAPWRVAQIAHALHGAPAPVVPQGAALADAVAAHHDDILSHYGADLGLRVARKHLGWYAEAADLPDPAAARRALMAAADAAAARRAIAAVFSGAGARPFPGRAA